MVLRSHGCVQVKHHKYLGRLEGLCGDNNYEYVDEFVTPEQCVFYEEEDFLKSYAFNSVEGPSGYHVCPVGVVPRGGSVVSALKKKPINKYARKEVGSTLFAFFFQLALPSNSKFMQDGGEGQKKGVRHCHKVKLKSC